MLDDQIKSFMVLSANTLFKVYGVVTVLEAIGSCEQMITRSDGCGGCLVANDGHEDNRTCGYLVSADARTKRTSE